MYPEKIFDMSLPYPERDSEKLVRVFVPEHEEGETFPVIYMTDGQNLFEDNHPMQFGCWYTREAVRAESKNEGQAAVIVGIYNNDGPEQRANELTPKSIGRLEGPEEIRSRISPSGELFDDFVINTVMPAVEAHFPVMTGRNNTAFCGSSSGGLQTFFTVLTHTDKFCAGGVFSPPFMFYSFEDLTKWIHGKIKPDMPYLYIYTGAGDELEKIIYQSTEMTYDVLTECYPAEKLNEVILLENRHHETAWAEIFKDFLHTFLTRRNEF